MSTDYEYHVLTEASMHKVYRIAIPALIALALAMPSCAQQVALKSGFVIHIQKYHVAGKTLYYVGDEGKEVALPLDQINMQLTEQLNAAEKTPLNLPGMNTPNDAKKDGHPITSLGDVTRELGAKEQPPKSIAEAARENREAVRKSIEKAVDEMCSKAGDLKMQEIYPKIQDKCKDKPALIQAAFESAMKSSDRLANSSIWKTASSSVDSVAAAQARVDRVCKYGLSTTPEQITSTIADCDKAYKDLENAMNARAAAASSVAAGAGDELASPSNYVISLTGTPGLPVTGTCSFAGKSASFDDVLPAEHVLPAGRGVLCSFVKKYVEGTLKMQIIQNGTLRDEAETEASYGVVSLTVDW